MIRTLIEADLPALTALCQTTLPLDTFTYDILYRRIFQEPGVNERYLLVDEREGQLTGVMLGSTRMREGGPQAWLRLFSVTPDVQNQGIASKLLAELEARLREDGISMLNVANSAPDYFWPGIDVRYTPGICWLLKQGFKRCGDAFNMEVPLKGRDFGTEQAEIALAEQGIIFRRLAEDDRNSFEAWMRANWSSSWQHEALASYDNDPVTTFIALDNGKVCAFASYDTTMFSGSFGPTGTAQHLRGKGIGSVLFLRCMADMQARGYSRSEICWVGPIAFYAKVVGAHINRVFWHYCKTL